MGGDASSPLELNVELIESYYAKANNTNFLPDVGIDESLSRYSHDDSDAVLQQHLRNNLARADLTRNVPQYFQSLGQALAPSITKAPNAVGMSAVVISIFLDLLLAGRQTEDSDVPAMLRRIFNEEKSNAIRVTMKTYLKQHRIHKDDTDELLSVAKQAKDKLAEQLTDLKGVMDAHMASHHLKYWVNGAAFHVLLLAHIANMKHAKCTECPGCGDCSDKYQRTAANAIDVYEEELYALLHKYKKYKMATTTLTNMKEFNCYGFGSSLCYSSTCELHDSERQQTVYVGCPEERDREEAYGLHRGAYVERLFAAPGHIAGLKTYFGDVKASLGALVTRHGVFRVPPCREVRRTYPTVRCP